MLRNPPKRYVISGLDSTEEPTPVAYRVTTWRPGTPENRQSCFVLPEYVRGLTRPLREERDEVITEPIYEIPERYLTLWMVIQLCRVAPPELKAHAEALLELAADPWAIADEGQADTSAPETK